MPDPQQAPSALPPVSYQEFAAAVRRAHPSIQQAAPDIWDHDDELTHAMVKAYPELGAHVIDPFEGTEGVKMPGLTPNTAPGPVPPPEVPAEPAFSAFKGPLGPAASSILRSPIRGGLRMVEGATKAGAMLNSFGSENAVTSTPPPPAGPLNTNDVFEPLADLAGGAMEAGELALVPAFAAAPAATAVALGVGSAAASISRHLAEMAGAPPTVAELAEIGGGLLAGAKAGGMTHDITAAPEIARAARVSRFAEEDAQAKADIAREHVFTEGAMRADLQAETAAMAGEQVVDQERFEALARAIQQNEMLNELSKSLKVTQGTTSPFEYLDEVVGARKALPPGPVLEPPLALPPATGPNPNPDVILAPPSSLESGGLGPDEVQGVPTNVDRVGPPVPEQRIAASGPEGDYLLTRLGDELEAQLGTTKNDGEIVPATTSPLGSAPPRLSPESAENAAGRFPQGPPDTRPLRQVDADVIDKLMHKAFEGGVDDKELARLRTILEERVRLTHEFRRASDEQGATDESLLREIARGGGISMQAETENKGEIQWLKSSMLNNRSGVFRGKGLALDGMVEYLQHDGRFRDITDINSLLARLGDIAGKHREAARVVSKRELGAGGERFWEDLLNPPKGEVQAEEVGSGPPLVADNGEGVPPGDQGFAGPPPVPNTTAVETMAPPVTDEAMPAGFGELPEEEPTLPGLESVPQTENPTPEVADLPFALSKEPGAPPAVSQSGSLFDALKEDAGNLFREEEGSIGIPPKDARGLRKWLQDRSEAYGDQGWHEQATEALENGDKDAAWRIAAIASANEFSAGVGARKREGQAAVAMGQPNTEAQIEATKAAYKKQAEKELGFELPPTTDISPEGVITFDMGGKGVPMIKARATDMVLGKNLTADMTALADPSQIIRVEGEDGSNKALQISSQIADQLVRGMSDSFVDDMAELTGLDVRTADTDEARVEIARQYRRAFSNWGSGLGKLGRWTQENESSFYHMGAVDETGAAGELGSVGALQAHGVLTPEGFVKWLGGKASEGELKDLKFELPKGLDLKKPSGELTPEAKIYARNWFRRQQRLLETQKTIDTLAGEQGNALDRAVLATTIAPELTAKGGGRGAAITSLTKAALISKPGTMIRNTVTQAGRYGAGVADEMLASWFSLASGNIEQARLHQTRAKYLLQGTVRKGGSTLALFKHPWEDGLQAIYDYSSDMIAGLPGADMRKTLAGLEDFAHQETRLLGSLSLEGEQVGANKPTSKYRPIAAIQRGIDLMTQPAVRNTLTVFNRVQEHFFRATVFDAMVRAQLEAKGIDATDFLTGRHPRELVQRLGEEEMDRIYGAAVSTALDYTFAADPLPGTAPARLLKAFTKVPVLSFLLQLGQPFPRFNFVSAPRWVWDHTLVAPLVDIPLALVRATMFSDSSPMFRGRFHQMLQMSKQTKTLLNLDTEIGRTEYDAAKYLGDFMSAKEGAREAAKSWKAMENRGAKAAPLLLEELAKLHGDLRSQVEASEAAKAKWREAEARITNLKGQRNTTRGTYEKLQAVGAAKSPQEYFARVATGSALMAAGWAFAKWKMGQSTTKGSSDLQWYEMPTGWIPEEVRKHAGVEGQTIDMRAYSPEIQHFFMPDVLTDVGEHTDWAEWSHADAAKDPAHYIPDYMHTHYTGKYTQGKFMRDALEAYFTMTPAAGSTRDLMDLLTGRAAEGSQPKDIGDVQDMFITLAGQYIARLTVPLTTVSDVAGEFLPEEGKARIPAESGSEHPTKLKMLAEPTIANIPGLRETIPEKINAITGRPVGAVDSLARLGGVTKRLQNRVEQEINATGLPYGAAVPRQSGDREFDNAVSTAYAKLLTDNFDQVLENEQYQGLTPELKREILTKVFAGLKKAAAGQVIGELEEGEQAAKAQSPATKDRLDRWRKYQTSIEEAAGPEPVEPPEPSAVEPGAPPAVP